MGKGWLIAAFALTIVTLCAGLPTFKALTGPTTASSWRIEVVDNVGIPACVSMALDDNDYPHISYYDLANSKFKYAHWTGSAWKIENATDVYAYYGGSTSLALDSQGRPHISYYDATTKDLKYAWWTGSEWRIETVGNENVGLFASMALDNADRPHVSYSNVLGDLKYALRTDGGWRTETIDNENYFVSSFTSIALDDNGTPHISYCGDTRLILDDPLRLIYVKRSENGWKTEIVDGSIYYFTSITLDSDGHPHIGYIDNGFSSFVTPPRSLKHASWTGSEWVIGTVDNEALLYLHPSIALDADDRPHISYLAIAPIGYHLKYAQLTEGGWRIETIDNAVFFGAIPDYFEKTSTVIDSHDRPHISYCSSHDAGGNLEYATVEVIESARDLFWLMIVVAICVGIGALVGLRLSRRG